MSAASVRNIGVLTIGLVANVVVVLLVTSAP